MKISVPLERYTDGVREIITTSQKGSDFGAVIATASTEDLATALEILTEAEKAQTRRRRIRGELAIRSRGEKLTESHGWGGTFCARWREMQALFGINDGHAES